jgi:hypothetical protein
MRLSRPAVAVLAGLVVVLVSACGGSGNLTPTPGGSSGPSSAASGAPSASVAPTPTPVDPDSIITQAISGGLAVKSYHIKVAVSGTIKAAVAQSGAAKASAADVKLDGMVIEGDLDAVNLAGHLSLSVPASAGMAKGALTGDLIIVSNTLYLKTNYVKKYDKLSLSDLSGDLPVAVPTAGPSALASVFDEVAQVRKTMQQDGVTTTLVGTDQIVGQDAYHFRLAFSLDKLNANIAAEASSSAIASIKAQTGLKSVLSIDSATVDFWIYKANNEPAQVDITSSSSLIDNFELMMTITNYDQPVTVTAPPASQVNP